MQTIYLGSNINPPVQSCDPADKTVRETKLKLIFTVPQDVWHDLPYHPLLLPPSPYSKPFYPMNYELWACAILYCVLVTMIINSRSFKNAWADSSATERSRTDVGVKHCTKYIIVADESPLFSTSACILLTSVAQSNLNQFKFISDIAPFSFLFLHSCFFTVQFFYDYSKKKDDVFLWYYELI